MKFFGHFDGLFVSFSMKWFFVWVTVFLLSVKIEETVFKPFDTVQEGWEHFKTIIKLNVISISKGNNCGLIFLATIIIFFWPFWWIICFFFDEVVFRIGNDFLIRFFAYDVDFFFSLSKNFSWENRFFGWILSFYNLLNLLYILAKCLECSVGKNESCLLKFVF